MASDQHSPHIQFNPELWLQRRIAIQEILKSLSPPPTSLLEVGCGEGSLLSFLTPCDDDLPITRLTGIDIAVKSLRYAGIATQQERDRWRNLTVELYEGSFEEFQDPSHEVIVASEVLEHLDPPAVHEFATVLLHRLKPRLLIITTPNREFNLLFEMIGQGCRFSRPGIPYKMRNDDHRFEWSRGEFQDWAKRESNNWGYDVSFHGVGTVRNALGQDLSKVFPDEIHLDVGDCTQIACFTAKDRNILSDPVDKGLSLFIRHEYTWEESEYPPSWEHTLSLLQSYGQYVVGQKLQARELWDRWYILQRAWRFHLEDFLKGLKVGKWVIGLNPDVPVNADKEDDETEVLRASLHVIVVSKDKDQRGMYIGFVGPREID